MKRAVFFLLFFLPTILSARKMPKDTLIPGPNMYAYAEGLGPGNYYSLNAEKLLLQQKEGARRYYFRGGFQWLPDLTTQYNLAVLGGLGFESGKKNWSRNFQAGATFWIDHYNWQKKGELSAHCSEKDCDPTLRWGPFLSLGARYRFDDQLFCSFEFTPVLLSQNDGWNLYPFLGAGFGFLLNPKK